MEKKEGNATSPPRNARGNNHGSSTVGDRLNADGGLGGGCASALSSRLTSAAIATAAVTSPQRLSRAVPSRALTTYWCRRGVQVHRDAFFSSRRRFATSA